MAAAIVRGILPILRFKKNLSLCLLLFICAEPASVFALEIPQWWKDVHQYDPDKDAYDYMTYTSSYFGPNALPVPELYDGRVPEKNMAEVSVDGFWGFGDQTQSLSTRLTYVPKPGRLSISFWGVLLEHYQTTPAVRDERASMIEDGKETFMIGDLYLSTLMSIFKEKKYVPDINLEIVLKTSASQSPYNARYFDTPGYWFDLTAGKSLKFQQSFIQELRFVGTYGFLCYQLNSARQNDAPLYGAKVILSSKKWSFENGIHGYSGWLDKGDKPQVLRSKFDFCQNNFHYFLEFQYALRDYPFHRIQAGVNLSF